MTHGHSDYTCHPLTGLPIPRLMPDTQNGDHAGLFVHVINQQVTWKPRHKPFTSPILARAPLERKRPEAVAGSLNGSSNGIGSKGIVLGYEGADLPEIGFSRVRPNHFHVDGGSNSSDLPHESSHLHISV